MPDHSLDKPCWEGVGSEFGRVRWRTFLSEESAQTKSKRHIVFRDKSNYSEILTQKFDLIRIFAGEIVNVCVYTKFSDGPESVVFLGPPGAGKTHLASALGLEAA